MTHEPAYDPEGQWTDEYIAELRQRIRDEDDDDFEPEEDEWCNCCCCCCCCERVQRGIL